MIYTTPGYALMGGMRNNIIGDTQGMPVEKLCVSKFHVTFYQGVLPCDFLDFEGVRSRNGLKKSDFA